MGSRSSRSSTETSPSTCPRSKPTRTAWSSFVTRCEGLVARQEVPEKPFESLGSEAPAPLLHDPAHVLSRVLRSKAPDGAYLRPQSPLEAGDQPPCDDFGAPPR